MRPHPIKKIQEKQLPVPCRSLPNGRAQQHVATRSLAARPIAPD
jgi:hypothetical protein